MTGTQKSPTCQEPAGEHLGSLIVFESLALNNLACLDAACADADALAAAIDLGFDRLKVDVPAPTRGVVGVGDVVAELRAFAAEIAFLCHDELLQSRIAETSLNPEDRVWKSGPNVDRERWVGS